MSDQSANRGRAPLRTLSATSPQTSIESSDAEADKRERLRLFSKFFALTTVFGDRELKIRACIDETRDIPAALLQAALGRLQRRWPGGKEAVLSDIRRECAMVLREKHRAAQGLDPNAGLDWSGGVMDDDLVERWLQRAHDPVPKLIAAPDEQRKATPEERARGAALLASKLGPLERRARVRR